MKKSELKYFDTGNENVQLYHNTGLSGGVYVATPIWDPWNVIAKGTNRHNRIGDEITPIGFKLRLWVSNKYDRTNVMYRVVACIMPRAYNGAVVTNGSIDPAPAMNLGAVGNYMCLPWDTEKGIKVLYDRIHQISGKVQENSLAAGKECSKLIRLYIKRKRSRNIKYAITNLPVNNIFAVYVIPYDAYGTLTTDNIASCAYNYRLYFKDV